MEGGDSLLELSDEVMNKARDEGTKKTNALSTSKGDLFGYLVTSSEYHQRRNNQDGKERDHQQNSDKVTSSSLRRVATAPTAHNTPTERSKESSPLRTPLSCLGCAIDRRFECKWCGNMYKTGDERRAHIARRHPYKLK